MRAPLSLLAALALVALPGCKDDPAATPAPTDSGPAPEPGPLTAGFAKARIPAPVGIGTVGYGPFGAPSSPSPFSTIYPGTTGLSMHPEIKVTAISRGEGFEVVFVRVDAVGMFQQLRRAVVLELQERTGRDLDDALVFGATHTHSGPGRVIDGGGLFDIIADQYHPEFYDRFVNAMADTIEAALDDLQPARVATSAGYSAEAHKDRRCEDGHPDYENGTTPFIAIERDGELQGIVATYAVHGTALSIDDLMLSQDVFGAMETALEDHFDHPVDVLVMNAWAADMAPSSGEIPLQEGGPLHDGLASAARTGWQFAEDLAPTVTGELAWEDEPVVDVQVHRARIDRDVIGYEDGVFPHVYGAVYCEKEGECAVTEPIEGLDQDCLPFNEMFPAPNQTVFSAGQVGDLHLITFPGEPGTRLAEQVIADIQAQDPHITDVMFVGYGQDYLGYSILEDDWWQGGYEAGGHLWGPRQGEYLADVAVQVMGLYTGSASGLDEPDPITPFDEPSYTPYEAEEAVAAGDAVAQPGAVLAPSDAVVFAVNGLAPWLGAPLATVHAADGSAVLRANGEPWTSDEQPFVWSLTVAPSYAETLDPQPRTFTWSLSFPVRHPVPDTFALEPGDYTVQIALPDGTVVESEPFSVTE